MRIIKKLVLFVLAIIFVFEPLPSFATKENEFIDVIWVDSALNKGYFYDGMAKINQKDYNEVYIDTYGNIVTDGTCIPIDNFNEGVGYIQRDNIIYPINRKGEIITLVDNEGRQEPYLDKGFFIYFNNNYPEYGPYAFAYTVTDIYGRKVLPGLYQDISFYISDEYISAKTVYDKNNQNGVTAFNLKGKPIVNASNNGAGGFLNPYTYPGLVSVGIPAGEGGKAKFAYYDLNGKQLIPYILDHHATFREDRAAVYSNGKYGYIDKNCNIITSLIYDFAKDFENGFGVVTKGGYYAVVNRNGKVITPFAYNDYKPGGGEVANDNMIIVGLNDKFGYVSQDGKSNIACVYENAERFSEGLGSVQKDGKWGYINKSGKTMIPFKFDYAGPFEEGWGYAKVRHNGKEGLIDKKGNFLIPPLYNYIYTTSDLPVGNYHYIAQVEGNKTAIYDKIFNLIIPANYTRVAHNNYPHTVEFLVMQDTNRKYAIFDIQGKQITEFKYDILHESINGVLAFKQDGLYGLVDLTGTEIVPATYDHISKVSSSPHEILINGFYATKDNKIGIINEKGNYMLPIEYDEITSFLNGLAWVRKGDNWGIIKAPSKYDDYSSWAKDSIKEAKEKDLVPFVCDGYFTKPITRLEFASLVTNLAEKVTGKRITPASIGQFKDTKADAALRAYSAGIITGSGNDYTFAPNDVVTREQAATMLYRTIKYIEQNSGKKILSSSKDLDSYVDQGRVSSWAREAISALAGSGIMEGTSKTTLSPSNKTSIEEAIILALRIYNLI